jgi:division protein CdvB (Snf7/Vps24/ESCRT-III family)
MGVFKCRVLAYKFKQFFISLFLHEVRLSLGEIILVNRFIDKWAKRESEPSLTEKIKNVGKPSQDLKQQINVVIQRLDTQTQTLDMAVKRFEARDAGIFQRVVKAISDRDNARANILATELGEIRKVEKMLSHASLALQGVSMRLNTVSEIGDVVSVLSPAKSMLNSIRSEMCSILPEASQELGNIGSLLSDIVTTTNQSADMPVDTRTASEDAEKILEEAEMAAAQRLSERFPEVGTGAVIGKRASIEA